METKCMTSSSPLTPKTHIKNATITPKWAMIHQRKDRVCLKFRIFFIIFFFFLGLVLAATNILVVTNGSKGREIHGGLKKFVRKEGESFIQVEEEPVKGAGKKGTIAGAVALIIGTSIGSGILALPQKASPAVKCFLFFRGVFPGSISLIICWAFLLIEALLLIEINVRLRIKKRKKEEESLLIAIEVLAAVFGGWSGLGGNGDWGKVPATIPVMIFSLVYHDIAPVLCAYLGGDLTRLRASVFLRSLVLLLALLVWDAIALGLSAQADQLVDPIELLMRVKWSGVSFMVESFSLLAVGTSMIGTLLGFSEFFKEQLKNLSWHSSSIQITPLQPDDPEKESDKPSGPTSWWGRNKIGFTAMAMVVTPTLLVSSTGGIYCMTLLYGVLPAAMAWAMQNREGEESDQTVLTRARPALFGVGLFACGVVVEQIVQDFLALRF
ncbi:hypothetical protein CRYUN_Cryun41cG0034900 [Craigia yunnanensis]